VSSPARSGDRIGRGQLDATPDNTAVARASEDQTGTDAMCLMHLSTATREWYGLRDSDIAAELFGKYGFASGPDSIEATAPVREQSRASMVQRGTDAQFLRNLRGEAVDPARMAGPDYDDIIRWNTGHGCV